MALAIQAGEVRAGIVAGLRSNRLDAPEASAL
jgi:hypothetical protein